MTYSVKERYYTLQGEGANVGHAAVFCRFSGCNLWSGQEQHRERAICQFCDTEFAGVDGPGGGRFRTADELAEAVNSTWLIASSDENEKLVVCTGGEPLLQLDSQLVDAFHARGFLVAIETNGTLQPPQNLDWICMSPKSAAELALTSGDELKLIFPQPGAEPERYDGLDFRHFFLQPMDNSDRNKNTELALAYCLAHPKWRLSLQTHKLLGIP